MRVFKDEEKLSPEYVPSNLPHREEELKLLRTFFSSVIEGGYGISTRVIVSGSVGTGKSALVKLFGREAAREAAKRGVDLRFLYVNCRVSRTAFTTLKRLAEQLKANVPQRGFSDEELFHRMLDYLDSRGIYAIIALDEVERLLKEEGAEPFYLFSRVGEERLRVPRYSVILILRNPEILDALDLSTRSALLGNIIHLREYSSSELYDIVRFRSSEAFRRGAVMDDSLRLIADMAGERGDARYALDILWRAGKYAEADESPVVTPEHVRKAAASVYPAIRREHLEYLSPHERLILLALSSALDSSREAYITSNSLYQEYRLVCEEYSAQPRAYTRFWEFLQRLDDLGIIRIKVKSEGARGRKSYISLPGIPVSILRRELESIIEREKFSFSSS